MPAPNATEARRCVPRFEAGQRVRVDLTGLEVPGALIRPGDSAAAVVVRDYGRDVTVDTQGFRGLTRLTVEPSRVS